MSDPVRNMSDKPAVALITAHGWVGVSTPVIMTAAFLAQKGYAVDLYMDEDPFCNRMGINIPGFKDKDIHLLIHRPDGTGVGRFVRFHDLDIPEKDMHFFSRFRDPPRRYDFLIGFDPDGLVRAGILGDSWGAPYIYHSLELFDETAEVKHRERWFSKRALLTFTQDEYRAKILSKLNGVDIGKIAIVYNNSTGEALREKKDYFRTKLAIAKEKVIVLATGTLLPIHGVDRIIASVARWPDRFVLVLHGWIPDPAFESYIRSSVDSAKGKIHLSTDILGFNEKFVIFQSADIGLSFYEPSHINLKFAAGASGKTFDFMRCGVPVIGNDIPGMKALIEENGCGFVVRDAMEIGRALSGICSDYSHFRDRCFPAFEKYGFVKSYEIALSKIIGSIDSNRSRDAHPSKPAPSDRKRWPQGECYLASFPRSGNTWLRLLLSDAILQMHGLKTDTEMVLDLSDRIIPDMHCDDIGQIDDRIKLPFRLVKTHDRFSPNMEKAIFLFRSPADALCSYYHYKRGHDILEPEYQDHKSAFALGHVHAWEDHARSFLNAYGRGARLLFVSYESLHERPISTLRRIFEFLGLRSDESLFRIAVKNHAFVHLRDKWVFGTKYREHFFRKGRIGSAGEELDKEVVRSIEASAGATYRKALEMEKPQMEAASRMISKMDEAAVLPDATAFSETGENRAVSDGVAEKKRSLGFPASPVRLVPQAPKVVHLCAFDYGGAGRAAWRLHCGLRAIGLESTMLVLEKRGHDPKVKILTEGTSHSWFAGLEPPADPSASFLRAWQRWSESLSGYPNRPRGLEIFTGAESVVRLDGIPEILDADIVHLHWVAGLLDYGSVPVLPAGKPIVWTLHDMNPLTGGCHYAGECSRYTIGCGRCPQLGSDGEADFSRLIWRKKYHAFEGFCIHAVAPSRWLGMCASKSRLISRFPVSVIPNGLPLDVFKPYPRPESRRALGISDSSKVVLFGAESVTNRRKGIQDLMEALDRLEPETRNETAFLVFGELPENAGLEKKQPVIHVGHTSDENQLARIYSAADVFALPSLEDNLPNTALEAMACGVPVVGYRVGGIPDIVSHKETGFLAAPRDVQGLSDGIRWVLSTPEESEMRAGRCRAGAVEKYPLEKQVRAYMELYDRIRKTGKKRVTTPTSDKGPVYGMSAAQDHQEPSKAVPARDAVQTLPHGTPPPGIRQALKAGIEKLEQDPDHVPARIEMGWLMLKTQRWQTAVLQFRYALEVAPEDPSIRKELIDAGKFLTRCGRVDKARELYLVLLAKNPENRDATCYWSALRDSEQAREIVEIHRAKPDSYKISAIVSTYRSESFIGECLENLSAQSIADEIEIVVVDAASPENEKDIVLGYRKRHPNIAYFRTQARIGVYAAWNIAIAHATGRYCISVSTNDQLRRNACELLARELDRDPKTALIYGDTLLTRKPHETFEKNCHYDSHRWDAYSFAKHLEDGCCIGPHPMWRRSVHETLGYFDDRFVADGDQDFWMRLGISLGVRHVPEMTGLQWITPDSLSLKGDVPFLEVAYIQAKYRRILGQVSNRRGKSGHRRSRGGNITMSGRVTGAGKPVQTVEKASASTETVQTDPLIPPLVSIVMPTFHGEAFLSAAISSVLGQTYPRWELILSDDGSTDRTIEIIKSFDDPRIRCLSHGIHQGLTANLNRGIRDASGDFICWLNQDDLFYPQKLERQVRILQEHPKAGACFSAKDDIDAQGRPVERFNPSRERIREEDHLVQLFGGCYLSAPTVMLRSSVFQKVGWFNEAYKIAFDYEMWFRIKKHFDFIIVSDPLMAFRHHSKNQSSESSGDTISLESAAIVSHALRQFSVEEIYPFLQEIEDAEIERIEKSACLASLARLIWNQKSCSRFLVADILGLVGQAVHLNPDLCDAFELGLKVARFLNIHEMVREYERKRNSRIRKYDRLVEILGSVFYAGQHEKVQETIREMYGMQPFNGDPYVRLAECYCRAGDVRPAIASCENALRLNKESRQAEALLASLLKRPSCPTLKTDPA